MVEMEQLFKTLKRSLALSDMGSAVEGSILHEMPTTGSLLIENVVLTLCTGDSGLWYSLGALKAFLPVLTPCLTLLEATPRLSLPILVSSP